MASEKVRVGVVGVGGMGTGHCRSITEKVEEMELVAVADIVAERARQVGEEFGVRHFPDYKELIHSGTVDAVVVATPHYFHPVVSIEAFNAGLHVLSEKPVAVQVSMAEKMIEAARKAGKVFSVMFQMRATPAVRKAKELCEGGEIGEIRRTMLVSPEFRSQAYYDSGSWRATWAGEGGGVMMNQAPHIMDVFTMLGGMPSRVHGRCATLMHEIEVEDHAEAMLQYSNGACGYFYTSTCEVGTRMLEIVGYKGKLQLVGGKLLFWRFEPPIDEFNRTNTEMWGSPKMQQVELDIQEAETGHQVILRNFARAILYGEPLIAPGDEAHRSLELANAITLSSHKGEPVDIPIDRAEYDRLLQEFAANSSFKDQWGETKVETDPQFKKK